MRQESGFSLHGRCSAGRTVMATTQPGIFRQHGLPVWTLNYTADGRGRFDGDGPRLVTEMGDLILIKPGILNDYGPADGNAGWIHLWSVFAPEESWFSLLDWPEPLPGVRHLRPGNPTVRQKIAATFAELIDVARGPWPQRDDLVMSLLHVLFWWCDTANPHAVRRALDMRLQAALDHLAAHHDAPLSIDGLARAAGMSASRFAHLFRHQLGISPIRYLERHRINRACELLLATGHTVGDIAEEVGYEDPAYFARVFRRQTQMTPRAFRLHSRRRQPALHR